MSGLLLAPTAVEAVIINAQSTNDNQKNAWNADLSKRALFTKKHNTQYLSIFNSQGELLTEHLIPRAKNLSNITWAANNQYLTFTENDRNLWLFSLKQNSSKLIDCTLRNGDVKRFNVQWSPNGQWLQYLSNKNSHHLAKVYSIKRNRSYILPVNSTQIATINWQDGSNDLIIKTEGTTENEVEMSSLYGIKLIVKADAQIALLQ